MEIRMQKTSSANAGNAVYTYPDGSRAAILFVRVGDGEAMRGLAQVYRLHGALTANLSERVPRHDRTSGSCLIHDNGVTVTFGAVDPSIENGGHGMLGAEATVPWGATDPDWMNAALKEGCVWAGLISEEVYQRVCLAHPVVNDGVLGAGVHLSDVPSMPVLKLTAQRG
jgi:hypothetical protein